MAAHGTDAGYQAHRRRGTHPCEPCRAAHSTAMDEYKTRHVDVVARAVRRRKAKRRALADLADLHAAEFDLLFATHLTAIEAAEKAAG